jgi:GH15 family glucan-1,4-alpha-glucosidase
MAAPTPIEHYAVIGDCETAALVSLDGSVDWLCWPRFDSDACFSALLGGPEHGRWRIAPVQAATKVSRRYRVDTMILETEYENAEGTVVITDFMPAGGRRAGTNSDLVRVVHCLRGRVSMSMQFVLRFDYGSAVPWVTRLDDGRLCAIAGPDMVTLLADVEFHGENFTSVSDFTVSEGERRCFVLTWSPSHLPPSAPIDPLPALESTEKFWRNWAAQCTYRGEWRDAVMRSLLTLKALTYGPTGGIVAAPTTSLPEQFGGTRNWDYRFCWLRDATLTLLTLMDAGYVDEAAAWRDWLLRAAAGSPQQVQIMYGIAGERQLPEREIPWLPGYADSKPVRVGNAAHAQLQLDVYGEVMDAMYQARLAGLREDRQAWALQVALTDHVTQIWREPDHGIWEVRGPAQHFTHSKVMSWVALDRSVKSIEQFGLEGPLDSWRAARQAIHDDVCEHGYDETRGCFVQSYGSSLLDASLLMIPLVGFLPAEDPRVRATVECIERGLMVNGFVLRYDSAATLDGLPPGEGAFLACSFWLADCLAMLGRRDDAVALFERLRGLANDVGLLAEEYDPGQGRFCGNFPQAFSHVALLNTAFNLAREPQPSTPKPAVQRGRADMNQGTIAGG